MAGIWQDYGGSVIRIDRFWEPPAVEGVPVVYGNSFSVLFWRKNCHCTLSRPTTICSCACRSGG